MVESDWTSERETLLERLHKAEQMAAESQAEAAVYRELLEDWYEAAQRARDQKNFDLLQVIHRQMIPFYLPEEEEAKQWGKHFLHAYMRDARWLNHATQALEMIKADAEKLAVEGDEVNTQLKRSIIGTAENGLITHI